MTRSPGLAALMSPPSTTIPGERGLVAGEAEDRGGGLLRPAAVNYDFRDPNIFFQIIGTALSFLSSIHPEAQMPDSCESPSPPTVPRSRSIEARRAARRTKAEREMRIVRLLNGGVSIDEIAVREGVSLKRMRAVVQQILARRALQPPAEFLALQVSRLNEALFVAYNAMSGLNLQAVDRVVKIVRELDRYHGFSASEQAQVPEPLRLAAPARSPLALEAPAADRPGKGAASH
jgi:DNA-binding CsgD family transcriptional regulator